MGGGGKQVRLWCSIQPLADTGTEEEPTLVVELNTKNCNKTALVNWPFDWVFSVQQAIRQIQALADQTEEDEEDSSASCGS